MQCDTVMTLSSH